ncbi:hypothetical protein KEM56_001890 [Ascosphaera pollenicola]|nr:hypothetical protein KEM56_001890 [Ascosphaera pollenicola]
MSRLHAEQQHPIMACERPSMKRMRGSSTASSPAKRIALPRAIDTDVMSKPTQEAATEKKSSIDTALHVLSSERRALANIERVYTTSLTARTGMESAVDAIAWTVQHGSKLVVTGVGKSGKVGQKIVATMNSLGIHTCFLHPAEALHGDLGMIRPHDVILAISYSGKTQELTQMISHIPPTTTLIAMTQHTIPSECALISIAANLSTILLPAPVHIPEEKDFGVAAPTTSTTVAIALGDALALSVANKIHLAEGKTPSEVFKRNHPGGAIGSAAASPGLVTPSEGYSSLTSLSRSIELVTPDTSVDSSIDSEDEDGSKDSIVEENQAVLRSTMASVLYKPLSELMAPLDTIARISTGHDKLRISDIIRVADGVGKRDPWVMTSSNSILPPVWVDKLRSEYGATISVSKTLYPCVQESSWIKLPSTAPVMAAISLIEPCLESYAIGNLDGLKSLLDGKIIAVLDDSRNDVTGFISAGDLLDDDDCPDD